MLASQKVSRKTVAANGLFYTGTRPESEVNLTLFVYDQDSYGKKQLTDLSRLCDILETPGIKWLNVDGIHDVDVVESIGLQFGVHFLVIEDILDVDQRPKVEDHGKYLYIVLKMVYYDAKADKNISEQVSIILFKDLVITFQEQVGFDVFDSIRNRIINNKGRIRKEESDFLAHAMLDAIVDNYISVMEDIGEDIAILEREVLTNPSKTVLEDIYNIKMDIIFFRKAIWPVREMIIQLQKSDTELIRDPIMPYFRDIYDHTLQALDSVKVYNDTIAGILDIYTSSISNKTNIVMRRLTFITTIFMPLSVLAGIGGMSEWTMMTGGEKNWIIAYPGFLAGLIVIGFITYMLLRKQGV
jgi:magnesium transporter